jgi:hypothetical protein
MDEIARVGVKHIGSDMVLTYGEALAYARELVKA